MPFDGGGFSQKQKDLDALRAVRENIARPGAWCQFTGGRADGARCILGWTDAVMGSGGREGARLLLRAFPRFELPGARVASALIAYNDAPGRTQAEVVALFDAAIQHMEADDAV